MEGSQYSEEEVEEMVDKVEQALIGTKNSSTPGPNGISYRLIKAIKDTPLGQGLLQEVAENLLKGVIPKR